MPYRYLEVVGRKYVATYKCKKVYVDMDEQLKVAEEKKTKKQEQKSEPNSDKTSISTMPKKDVFAKLKAYNNNITKESAAVPSKNAGSKDVTKKDNENVLLKETANRYTYEGKLANFNFLRPVDKKQIDKRLAMSWADFKATFN
jgi:Ni,Fe-hydrogenase I large subunit